ncbi:hypothetical protein P6P90_00860 [Ectobacillus antri]|uniref:Uncharacterized protein n=1 Tax=Ectobacillus antri TaxID=2486280 RepID=A0ABT6GZQ8_9BACI|nr:hypothetical protein [Ectobacillus antri]MDG4655875.1 hypothetical protein [Ectobacillus antri]MDG5752550.1 hypothetical protein [Ectobacillus antri]
MLLLPNLEMATRKQVADFYKVEEYTIENLFIKHRKELVEDGYITKTGKELKNLLTLRNKGIEIKNTVGCFLIETEAGFVKMANRSNGLFPKRAILRVGMLLRDSEVAKGESIKIHSSPSDV